MKRWILNLKIILILLIALGFLSIPLYYPLAMHNFLVVLAVIIQTSVLTESSIPVWIYYINLDKWDTAWVVIFFSQVPLVLIFWPQIITKHLSEKNQNKLRSLILWAKLNIKKIFQKKPTRIIESQKLFLLIFFILFFLPDSILLNLLANLLNLLAKIKWYHVFLLLVILFFCYHIWNHFKKNGQGIKQHIINLGYIGITIGAGTPVIPLTREAGLAAVFLINDNRAKMLFIAVDILRIILEIILIY